MSLLLRQMMHAVGYRYAAHEINLIDYGSFISGEFRYVPLQFFERRTGRLRFCPVAGRLRWNSPGARPLAGHRGAGYYALLQHCLLLQTPAPPRLAHLLRQNMACPAPQAKQAHNPAPTNGRPWKEPWAQFAAEFAAVMSKDDTIEAIDLTASGNIPHPALVDRMDRALTILWRGGDLSTMSSTQGEGRGASLMGDEMEVLDAADCMMLSEALRMYVDRPAHPAPLRPRPACLHLHPHRHQVRHQTRTRNRQDPPRTWHSALPERHLRALQPRRPEKRSGRHCKRAGRFPERWKPPWRPRPPQQRTKHPPPAPDPLEQASQLYAAARAQDLKPLAERLAYIIESVPRRRDCRRPHRAAGRIFPNWPKTIFNAPGMPAALTASQTAAMAEGLKGTPHDA